MVAFARKISFGRIWPHMARQVVLIYAFCRELRPGCDENGPGAETTLKNRLFIMIFPRTFVRGVEIFLTGLVACSSTPVPN